MVRPISYASSSALPVLRTISSTRWASRARSSSETGRPWHALRTPLTIFSRLNGSEAPDRVAWHLGRALQLTNILRDLAEDAERGRLYLPREWLDEAGMPALPEAVLRHERLASVCARAAAQAHEHFRVAEDAMRACDARAMRPARLMGATYAAVLRRLERRGWERPAERVRLPRWQKLWIALRYAT